MLDGRTPRSLHFVSRRGNEWRVGEQLAQRSLPRLRPRGDERVGGQIEIRISVPLILQHGDPRLPFHDVFCRSVSRTLVRSFRPPRTPDVLDTPVVVFDQPIEPGLLGILPRAAFAKWR